MGKLRWVIIGMVMASGGAIANPVPAPVCGTGGNAAICFATIDQSGHLDSAQRARLAQAGAVAIDVISSPEFERELTAFYAAHGDSGGHAPYWRGFDPHAAVANTRASFDGLHIETIGGVSAWWDARVSGNVAYEGSTRPDGSRDILLNRHRLDRPVAQLVATYVHEASHKAGYSHRRRQTPDQKCEPPYVMGQIARKLADPAGWPAFARTRDACRLWQA